MSTFLNVNQAVIPPLSGDEAPAHRQLIRLQGSGGTPAVNARPLIKDRVHLLIVGTSAVRVAFHGTPSGTVSNTTDLLLSPGTIFPFQAFAGPTDSNGVPRYGSQYVVVDGNGGTAFEAFIVLAGR